MAKIPAPKSLVVLGGGIAGHAIAYRLKHLFAVTLVDPKTYLEVPMAAPRLLVDPDALQARIPYAHFLDGVTVVQGRATGLTDGSVAIAPAQGGTATLPFDFAVIATGSRYADPLIKAAAPTEAERAAEIAVAHARHARARTVVIVGGGAVGVETAGEFLDALPEVKVVLVDPGPALLPQAPSRFSGWATQFLTKRGVELILGDRVASPGLGEQPVGGVVTTASGRTIPADAVVWATGVKVATEFVSASWPDSVEPDGRVRTDPFLRVEGHPSVFVVGDATNLPESRMAVIAGLHVKAVVASLTALGAKRPERVRLKPYKVQRPGEGTGKLMLVTLGRRAGLSSLPFGQFRARVFAKIKGEDMLVGRVRKDIGLDPA